MLQAERSRTLVLI